MKRFFLTSFAMGIGLFLPVFAQNPEEIRTKYPNEQAIVWNNEEHLTIYAKNDNITASSTSVEETMLLTNDAARYYNTGYIYHSSFHKLKEWEAASLIPNENGKYKSVAATNAKTIRSEDESVFYDDAKQTKITFPSLTKGAITRLNYTTQFDDIHFLPAFYFQSSIPTEKALFTVTVPKEVQIGYIMYGQNREYVKFSKEEKRNETIYKWEATSVPQLKRYDDAPSSAFYIPHVLVYIASYQTKKMDKPEKVFGTTDDLYKYYRSFVGNVNTTKSDTIQALVNDITKTATTPKQKAESIYSWVQNNIKYIAFEDGMGGFVPREAAKVCSRRFGDCKDMSSLLLAMCKAAGIDAYYTWIGTRRKPYSYSEVPLPITDNHMICAIKLDGQFIFLDGTDPNIPFGVPPSPIQGKEALIAINETSYKVITVPIIDAAKNHTIDSTKLTLDGNLLKGNVAIHYNGYQAWRVAGVLQYTNEKSMSDVIKSITERGSNKYLLTDNGFKYGTTSDKPLVVTATFTLADYARQLDNEYYINLHLSRLFEEEYADEKERKVPISFSYKMKRSDVVVLNIPQGYTASYIPENKEESVPGLWSYKITYKQNGKQIVMQKDFELFTLYIELAQFKDHNKMVKSLKAQQKEAVVLKKQ